MVGIVIVSHSSKVSEGIVDIIKQMTNEDIPIVSAGGTTNQGIGTDAIKIKEAIEKVDSGKGVLIFVDLGSAVLSSETAIDFTDVSNVEIVDAPIVEGALAAAVKSTITDSIEEIKKSAFESKTINKI